MLQNVFMIFNYNEKCFKILVFSFLNMQNAWMFFVKTRYISKQLGFLLLGGGVCGTFFETFFRDILPSSRQNPTMYIFKMSGLAKKFPFRYLEIDDVEYFVIRIESP